MNDSPILYGDGIHDDTDAIRHLLDTQKTVYLPEPKVKYCISGTLFLHSGQTLRMDRFTEVMLLPQSNCLMLANADMQNGNENICVSGGIWNMNNLQQHPNPIFHPLPGQDGMRLGLWNFVPEDTYPPFDIYVGVAMRFFNVKNLILQDLTVKDPITFAIEMARMQQVTVENIVFDFNHGNPFPGTMDGVHLDGECRFVTIRNLKGNCYDDLVALNADDAHFGPIEDVEIDGIFAGEGHSAVRMLSTGSPIRRISVSNVFGNFYQYAVAFSMYYEVRGTKGLFDQITLRDLHVAKAPRYSMYRKDGSFVFPLIWMEKDTVIKTLLIENLHRRESVTAVETIGLDPGSQVDRLLIRNATQENATGEPIPWLHNQGQIGFLDLSCIDAGGDTLLQNDGTVDLLQADGVTKKQL